MAEAEDNGTQSDANLMQARTNSKANERILKKELLVEMEGGGQGNGTRETTKRAKNQGSGSLAKGER